jgi:hypothetical protein
MLDPAATLTLHRRCPECQARGCHSVDGRTVSCSHCRGRGEWDETVTLAALAAWLAEQQGTVTAEGDGMPLAQARAVEHEARMREIAAAEVRRLVPARVTTGKKGGK